MHSYTRLFGQIQFSLGIDWDAHAHSEAFNLECEAKLKRLSSSTTGSESSQRYNLWDPDDTSSMTSDNSTHGVSKLEAYLYYYGLRGDRHLGPKLIYRTSADVFEAPSEVRPDPRKIQLLSTHEHPVLDQLNLWPTIRTETVKILDEKQVELSSVDLARFCWKEPTADGRGKLVFSRVTIWIGVLPDSTNADNAFDCCQLILKLLETNGINDIDIAFRESKANLLTGSPLYAPVSDLDPLKDVINWVTTALSIPIAGIKTMDMQGSLGFYFKVGKTLYAVTARHVLFPRTEGNKVYRYPASPRKDVVVMGNNAFDTFLASIEGQIGTLIGTLKVLDKRVTSLRAKAENGNLQAARDLTKTEADVTEKQEKIAALRDFWATMKKKWSSPNDRVIGKVVWSPPISGLNRNDPPNPSDGYTIDVCVIELDAQKFADWRGNVIDLGTKIDPGTFMAMMYPRADAQSEFDYPEDRLYRITNILSADKIKEPNNRDVNNDPVRFVIKNGFTTGTTIGRLNGYESFTRHYAIGTFDSIEAAVYPYDTNSTAFSRGGDSGAVIVGANQDFVALLTGSSGPSESSDVTYATPFSWLWRNVVNPYYPGAVLFFEPIPNN